MEEYLQSKKMCQPTNTRDGGDITKGLMSLYYFKGYGNVYTL